MIDREKIEKGKHRESAEIEKQADRKIAKEKKKQTLTPTATCFFQYYY